VVKIAAFFFFCAITFIRPRLTPYIIILIVPFMPKIFGGLAATTSLEEMVVMAAVAGMLCSTIFGNHISMKRDSVFYAYAAFLIILTSISLGHLFNAPLFQIRVEIVLYIKLLLPFFTLVVTRWAIQERRQINLLVHMLLGTSIILALMGILQHYMLFNFHIFCDRYYPLWGDPSAGVRFTYFKEATATFDGLHVYSGIYYMICSLIAAYSYFLGLRSKPRQVFYGVCFGLNMLALTLSFSRSAFISANIGLGIILAQVLSSMARKKRLGEIMFLMLLMMCSYLIFFPYVDKYKFVERFEAESSSALIMDNRGFCWVRSLKTFMASPIFGHGLKSIPSSWRFREPHNAYLQIAILGGMALLIPFFILIFMIARKLFKGRSDFSIGWGFPVFISMLVFEMSSFNLITWDRGRVNSILWVLLGLALSMPLQGGVNAAKAQERVAVTLESCQETGCAVPVHAFSPAECND